MGNRGVGVLPMAAFCLQGGSSQKGYLLRLQVYKKVGSRDGVVVRTLASHQCVPGSIPGSSVISGSSLLLVLFLAPRGFSLGTPVFPSPQKPTFPNSNLIWNCQALYHEPLARVIVQPLPVFDIKFAFTWKMRTRLPKEGMWKGYFFSTTGM